MIKYFLLLFVVNGQGNIELLETENVQVFGDHTECMTEAVNLYFNTEHAVQGACSPYRIKTEEGI